MQRQHQKKRLKLEVEEPHVFNHKLKAGRANSKWRAVVKSQSLPPVKSFLQQGPTPQKVLSTEDQLFKHMGLYIATHGFGCLFIFT